MIRTIKKIVLYLHIKININVYRWLAEKYDGIKHIIKSKNTSCSESLQSPICINHEVKTKGLRNGKLTHYFRQTPGLRTLLFILGQILEMCPRKLALFENKPRYLNLSEHQLIQVSQIWQRYMSSYGLTLRNVIMTLNFHSADHQKKKNHI